MNLMIPFLNTYFFKIICWKIFAVNISNLDAASMQKRLINAKHWLSIKSFKKSDRMDSSKKWWKLVKNLFIISFQVFRLKF